MSLDVKTIYDRLAPRGWRDLLLAVTDGDFDISQGTSADLEVALTTKSLAAIDRSRTGFDDFHRTANQAITGGRPSHSLLYHALASPNVHLATGGELSTDFALPHVHSAKLIDWFGPYAPQGAGTGAGF